MESPNELAHYVHLHIPPEELIDRLTVTALEQYLTAVLGEQWPAQLLEMHGIDRVRQTLRTLTAMYGRTFAKGKIRSAAAFMRWTLSSQPPLTPYPTDNPFDHVDQVAEAKSQEAARVQSWPLVEGPEDPAAVEEWAEVAAELRDEVPPTTWHTWLEPMRGHSYQNGYLDVVCGSEYAAQMISWRLGQLLPDNVRLCLAPARPRGGVVGRGPPDSD